MIKKEEFVGIMKSVENSHKINEKFNKLMSGNYYNPLENDLIFLLGKGMNLRNSFDSLSWWIYDLDFGKRADKDSLKINSKSVDISTADKFYDYLVKYEAPRG